MTRPLVVNDKTLSNIKKPIVVVDMGTNGLYSLNKIREYNKKSNIIYINDLEKSNYEEHDVDLEIEVGIIEGYITNLIERIKKYDPSLLVIVNDTLYEYGKSQFDSLDINKIYLNEEVIEEVNKSYEFKNMAFIAPMGMIEANIYQKNFHYTRLYSLNQDNMLDSLNGFKMKTSDSFNQVKVVLAPLYKKDVDIIIPSLPNTLLFQTELFEYIKDYNPDCQILNIDELLAKKVSSVSNNNDTKDKKYVYIVSKNKQENESAKDFKIKEKSLKKMYDKALNVNYTFLYE